MSVEGLDADWQALGLLESDPVDLGQVDVLRGDAQFTVTAPEETGTHTVTVTGAQTGVELTTEVTVTANPAPSASPSASPSPSVAPAAGSGSNGSLAVTGASTPWALAGIAATVFALGAYAVYRRRRGLA